MFKNTLRRFGRSKSGNFSLMLALVTIPILAAAGLAVDYTNISRLRTDIQAAADAAALIAAKEYNLNVAERKALAESFFAANNLEKSVKKVLVDIKGDKVTVSVDATPQTYLFRAVGAGDVDMQIVSTASSTPNALELVFALDVSGSMKNTMASGNSRMTELQNAVTDLIDQLQSTTSFDIRVGFVPFTMNVNIGTANSKYVTGDNNILFNGTSWKGCVFERAPPKHVDDNPGGKWNAYVWPPMPDIIGTGDGSLNPGNGTNTGYSALEEAGVPATDYDAGYIGPNYNCVRHPVVPLTADLTAAKSAVNALTAEYNQGTLIAPGVTWGMRLLTSAEPFTEGLPYAKAGHKILMVVTDGEQVTEAEFQGDGVSNQSTNSTTPWTFDPASHGLAGGVIDNGFGPKDNVSPYGFIRDSRPFGGTAANWDDHKDQLVSLSNAACDEVKDTKGGRNIEIYTLGVSDATAPGTRAYTALANCASRAKNHFYVQDSADLKKAFQSILDEFRRLRLTH